jgi:hypothetical protein
VRDGIICSPGKFESEAIFTPYFWDMAGDGGADILYWADGAIQYLLEINNDDRASWPEIASDTVAVILAESDQGFVSLDELTPAQLAQVLAEYETDEPQEENDDV